MIPRVRCAGTHDWILLNVLNDLLNILSHNIFLTWSYVIILGDRYRCSTVGAKHGVLGALVRLKHLLIAAVLRVLLV